MVISHGMKICLGDMKTWSIDAQHVHMTTYIDRKLQGMHTLKPSVNRFYHYSYYKSIHIFDDYIHTDLQYV